MDSQNGGPPNVVGQIVITLLDNGAMNTQVKGQLTNMQLFGLLGMAQAQINDKFTRENRPQVEMPGPFFLGRKPNQ